MKHSIKREQSHARMSFAEFENQRSLAEGESNVRATLKHMKLSFHLILTLAAMLTGKQCSSNAQTHETIIPSHPHPRRDANDGADGVGDRQRNKDVYPVFGNR